MHTHTHTLYIYIYVYIYIIIIHVLSVLVVVIIYIGMYISPLEYWEESYMKVDVNFGELSAEDLVFVQQLPCSFVEFSSNKSI